MELSHARNIVQIAGKRHIRRQKMTAADIKFEKLHARKRVEKATQTGCGDPCVFDGSRQGHKDKPQRQNIETKNAKPTAHEFPQRRETLQVVKFRKQHQQKRERRHQHIVDSPIPRRIRAALCADELSNT